MAKEQQYRAPGILAFVSKSSQNSWTVLSKKKVGERGEGGTSPFMSALSDLAREFRFHSGCDGQIWENFHS